MYDDMNRPIGVILFCIVIVMLFLTYSIGKANEAETIICTGIPQWITGEDMTAPMLESYVSAGQRDIELTEILYVEFDYSPYNGFYDWNGTWVVLNKLEDGRYRIWAGQDWTIGIDGQLHNPTCMMYVSSGYEWWFSLFPKLWYPTGEPYNH